MQSFFKILLVPFLLLFLPIEEEVEIKCLLEIMDYRGEGAYFVISVLDKEENYIKTVYVLGDNKSWFSELKYFCEVSNRCANTMTGNSLVRYWPFV